MGGPEASKSSDNADDEIDGVKAAKKARASSHKAKTHKATSHKKKRRH